MSRWVFDSCVVAKLLLPEDGSHLAQQALRGALAAGGEFIVLDLALPEVANAVWKRVHRGLMMEAEGKALVDELLRLPVVLKPAGPLIQHAVAIAAQYHRSVYDALFVALCRDIGIPGLTSDEPLFCAVHADYPEVQLLAHWTLPPMP